MKENRLKSIKIHRFLLIFITMCVFLSVAIIKKDNIKEIFSNVSEKSVGTYYSSITEYQRARWTEIQNAIFGNGVATGVVDTALLNKKIVSGNEYFNWTSNSAPKWGGGTSAIGVSRNETLTYTSIVSNGETNTNTVTYNVYDVYTAEQLKYVLDNTKNSTNNIKINVLSDLDFNGDNLVWTGVDITELNSYYYIEGNNHTFYNLNTDTGFINSSVRKIIIKNINFESVKIVGNKSGLGTFVGTGAGCTLFENLHVKKAYIQNAQNLTGGLYGNRQNTNMFIKNCSTEQCLIYAAGEHTGGFASITDGTLDQSGTKYNVSTPQVPEATFEFANTALGQKDSAYPAIIDSCYSIECEIFSTSGHSGGFVSCSDGALIMRNCFTNNTIYGNGDVGNLIGMYSGGQWEQKMYDDVGNRTIGAYNEECYTSGIVEGTMNIGGFVGAATSVVNKNCYSTASVGMDYSGTNIGGFIGYQNAEPHSNTVTEYSTTAQPGSVNINCYVAGEVGDIVTNTSLSSNEAIGGFIGNAVGTIRNKNCYYDKQTTGMREIAIGNGGSNHQIDGVNGIYTQASSSKGVVGLTTTTGSYAINMGDNAKWSYNEGFYPQIKKFSQSGSEKVKNYSIASASTVYLNHWDEIMDSNGNIVVTADKTIYDTIRDITSSFEFTSKGNSTTNGVSIVWNVDSVKNRAKGYIETLNIKDGANLIKSVPVLQVAKSNEVYKCYTFAPGKSWVKIEAGSGINHGTRRVRLIPTAYMEAGKYAKIDVKFDTTGQNVVQNNVTTNGVKKDNSKYNHTLDTLYAITDIAKLGDMQIVYPGQITSKNKNTSNIFAQWNTYPTTDNKLNGMVGQSLLGNSYPSGQTKLDIYKLGIQYNVENVSEADVDNNEITLPAIDYSSATKVEDIDANKWNGVTNFDESDDGWYELRYYWKLNDGRYLYNTKVVVIEGDDSTIEAKDIILNSNEYYENNNLNVTNDVVQNTVDKQDAALTIETENDRNVLVDVKDNNSVVKTKSIKNFNSDKAVIALGNDENHRLEKLTLKINTDDRYWIDIPVNIENASQKNYSYLYQNTNIIQNEETKEYSVQKVGNPVKINLNVKYEESDGNSYLIIQYTDSDSTKLYNSDIMVEAIYITIEDIVAQKFWVDKDGSKRPETIKLKITDNNNNEFSKVVSLEDEWKYTLEDAPTVDLNSNLIEYSVDEEETQTDDLKYYDKHIDEYSITNTIKNYDITTSVNGEGGKISGMTDAVYETVEALDSNLKDINIESNDGYRIKSIDIKYEGENRTESIPIAGTVKNFTLDKFDNITQDISVIVEFEKIPAKVIVKYIDEYDNEIIENIEISGFVNHMYSTLEKSFDGYKLVSKSDNTFGTFTENDIIVTYKYKKNTEGVEVKYIDMYTDETVAGSEYYSGLEGDPYESSAKNVNNYELFETPDNASGTMTVDKITVTYKYKLISHVTARYIDENTNKILYISEPVKYLQGDTYKTTKREIEGYTYSRVDKSEEAQVEREDITVTYYYKKNTKVTVKYVDMLDNNKEIHTSVPILGVQGDPYETSPIDIDGYEFIESQGETEGNMGSDEKIVVYKYKKLSKLITEHIDANTNLKITEDVTTIYKEGDKYEALPQNVSGYVVVQEPEEKTGIMGREEITKQYYYKKISAGLTVKYVDKITNALLDVQVYNGNENDTINLETKSFMHYLLFSKPDFNKVDLTVEPIEVVYYYVKSIEIDVVGIDENTGEELYKTKISGPEGDEYSTVAKILKDYEIVGENTAEGTFDRKSTRIEFVYKKSNEKKESHITLKYIDKDTGDVLKEDKITANVGDSYATQRLEFEYYDFVEVIGNENGIIEEEPQEVVYYYTKKSGKVMVIYEDTNGNEIKREEFNGKVGNNYSIDISEIKDYEIIEVSGNTKGTYIDGTIEIRVKLQKPQVEPESKGTIVVKYLDENGNVIKEETVKVGKPEEDFYIELPEIDGYKIIGDKVIKAKFIDGKLIFNAIYEKIEEPKEDNIPDTGDINIISIAIIFIFSIYTIFRKINIKQI